MLILCPIPLAFRKTRIDLYIVFAMFAVLLGTGYPLLQASGLRDPALATVIIQYVGASLAGLWLSDLSLSLISSGPKNFALPWAVFSARFFTAAVPLRVFTEEDYQLARRWIARILPASKD